MAGIGIGEVSAILGLLRSALDAVGLLKDAKENCKLAPDLTQKLVENVANTGATLGIINNVVSDHPEEDWNSLRSILRNLAPLLEVATEKVIKYSQKNVEREKATKVLECLKSTFKLGASKKKKVTEAMLKQIDSCRAQLDSIIGAETLRATLGNPEKERGQKLHTQLHEKAKLNEGNTRLDDIHVKLVGKDGKTLIALETYELAPQVDESSSSEESTRRRGRESGMRVLNSSEIMFEMSGNDGWFFYVVICELRKKILELFFPTSLALQKNGLHREGKRTFPDRSVRATEHDPRGLKMERSEGTPPDGDSPWSIFIIITSKQVLPKGEIFNTLLKMEDIAELLDQNDTEVLVKEFLIDVVKQADVSNVCSDRSLENPSSGLVAALSSSNEQASRNGMLRSVSSFLNPSSSVVVIMLLVALLGLRLPEYGFWQSS